MRPENIEAAIAALYAYGEAARGDGDALVGKTVEYDMECIADALESDTPLTAERLISRLGIIKTENGYEWE